MVESNGNKEITKHNPVSLSKSGNSGKSVAMRELWKCPECKRVREFRAEDKAVQVVCGPCQEEMVVVEEKRVGMEMTLGGWGG